MRASGIISVLVFVHAALAQAGGKSSSGSSDPAVRASSTTPDSTTGSSTGGYNGTSLLLVESETSSSGNPLVPSSASSTCTAFLNHFNTDATMSSCLAPLLNALSAFNPSTGTGSASSVSKALATLCSSNACSTSTMRAKLTEFKDACGEELTGASPNKVIIKDYDVLYALLPFQAAVCAKDASTQAYCLLNVASGSTKSTHNAARGLPEPVDYASKHLVNAASSSRRKRDQTVLVPNTDTYRNSNLMYLFTSPDMNASELCTSCTQQIISKYVAFESSTPYALGLKNSPLLGGQIELWSAIQSKCPPSYLSEVSNIAGVATADDINNGALPALDAGSIITTLAGAFAAALALV